MRNFVSTRVLVVLAFLSVGLGFPGRVRADVVYHVSVDTSSISGIAGDGIAFQFNPGVSPPNSGLQDAVATISNFAMSGGSIAFSGNVGGASGDATMNSLTIANSSLDNESDYNVTFGSSLSFDITLSGDAINNPNPSATFGTRFSLDLFDSNGYPLLTNDPNGSVLDIDIMAGTGMSTVTMFPGPQGQPPAASATLAIPPSTGVPEPSSLFLLGISLVGFGCARYRQSRRRQ